MKMIWRLLNMKYVMIIINYKLKITDLKWWNTDCTLHKINQDNSKYEYEYDSVDNYTLPFALLRIVEYKKERAHTDTERDLRK